jgi:hypothetical protein
MIKKVFFAMDFHKLFFLMLQVLFSLPQINPFNPLICGKKHIKIKKIIRGKLLP